MSKVRTSEYEDALNRLASQASYGIDSGDYEIMNREGYKKDMSQHYKDVETIRKALKLASVAEHTLEMIESGCSNAPEIARRVLDENK